MLYIKKIYEEITTCLEKKPNKQLVKNYNEKIDQVHN